MNANHRPRASIMPAILCSVVALGLMWFLTEVFGFTRVWLRLLLAVPSVVAAFVLCITLGQPPLTSAHGQQPRKPRRLPVLPTLLPTLLAVLLVWVSVESFGSYGQTLFLLSPFLIGAVVVMSSNRGGIKPIKESLWISLLAGCVALSSLIVVGLEGFLCIAFAAPLVLPAFLVGGFIGAHLSRQISRSSIRTAVMVLLCGLAPLLMAFDATDDAPSLRSVTTRVTIEGTPSDVWNEVIAFSPIPAPTEWLFRIGIAYPTDARIEGSGVGSVRYCNFSTGPFVEPITQWEEGRLLAFDVREQPIPMTEVSPYSIHPPHLDWAVVSKRGQFALHDLGDGRTELVGTTWYHTVMGPEFYWGPISDEMIRKIHVRVLEHIKGAVESGPR